MQTILIASSVSLALALCVLILFRRQFSLADSLLLIGLLGLSCAELLNRQAMLNTPNAFSLERWSLTVQSLAFWTLSGFSLAYARIQQPGSVSIPQRITLAVCVALPLIPLVVLPQALFDSTAQHSPWTIPLTNLGLILHLGLLLSILFSLYNLEGTLASATHAKRWRIKYFVLGLMAMLASQFLAISEGLLYKVIDFSQGPTRQIGLLLGVIFIGYSIITRGGEEKIVFSRRIAYKSLVLCAAGGYLISIGLVGQLMRKYGGLNTPTIITAFSLLFGILLLAVFLSDTARRKFNSVLRKYFYKDKYDYRLQWLDSVHRLTGVSTSKDVYEAVLVGFCQNLGMGQAALFLRNMRTGNFDPVSQWEMPRADTPLPADHPLCQPPVSANKVVDLRGKALDPPAPEASFQVALMRGLVLEGFILLDHPFNASEEYDEEDFELMEALAYQAVSAILIIHQSEELAEAMEMAALGKVSAFVLHDLKNLSHTLSLIVENAKNFMHDESFQKDMQKALDNIVIKIKDLIQKLRCVQKSESILCEDVNLLELARESLSSVPEGTVQLHGDPVHTTADKSELSKVLNNLFRNAYEASQGKSAVVVTIGNQGQPFIKVSDSGCGMDADFIAKRLFTPFSTTKEKGFGIGLYQSKQIVEAHGGRIEVESVPGQGSTFTVLLPQAPTASPAPSLK